MSQTVVSLLVHIVFSTKGRMKIINPEIEPELFPYISGIIRKHESKCLAINGTEDHVHLLVSMGKNVTVPNLLMQIKKGSSAWIKTQGPQYKNFRWQDGYGAFSIGQSSVPAVKRYIAQQKEHHKKVSFQSELLALLKKYEIEYDERYIWS